MNHYQDATIALHHGDCLDVLRSLPDASVDSIVTDPPYGLGFMGQKWDTYANETGRAPAAGAKFDHVGGNHNPSNSADASRTRRVEAQRFGDWCELWAAECLRVLKPGGHLLAFGGTRTFHRLACAVEDAGFEVRDSIAWLYGSGFPKSLDVSKAIDKMNGRDLAARYEFAAHLRLVREVAGYTRADMAAWFPQYREVTANWERRDNGNRVPTPADWRELRGRLPELSERFAALIDRVEAERLVIAERRATDRRGDGTVVGLGHAGNADITAPATDDARTWEGWGTALKPAFEPIVVARKPLTGTVAANVLAHGVGALNIDATRIPMSDTDRETINTMGGYGQPGWTRPDGTLGDTYQGNVDGTLSRKAGPNAHAAGRWPANVILDEPQAAELDAQSGESSSPGNYERAAPVTNSGGIYSPIHERTEQVGFGDSGGASRFFYVAKADAAERVHIAGTAHPTVKPLTLMRWLVRLVTPPGGTVLEPFAGSGTTVEACLLENFRCIAIEREADYLPLIVQRIHRRRDPVEAVKGSGEDGGLFDLLNEETA